MAHSQASVSETHDGGSGSERPGPGGRDETRDERADRLWAELLQEVRVTQTGVQILLAFLLSIAFTPRFPQLSELDRNIYVITVVFGAAATGALIAPVSFHRLVTGHRLKPQTVAWASRFTVIGLILLLCMVVCALLLILRVVLHDHMTAVWIVLGLLAWFSACWFLPALWVRHRKRTGDDGV